MDEITIEDGLQSPSLDDVHSCSSSILDSDDEDGINVTIKPAVPGGSDLNTPNPGRKLCGSERRRVQKLVKKGMSKEEARLKVATSTPKRTRDPELDSSKSPANPDSKRVRNVNETAGTSGGTVQSGGTMPGGVQAEKANIGGSATKQEGAKGGNVQAGGSTKKQDGPQGSAVQGDGSSKNPDGAQTTGVTKAHRDNLPAPTCAQIASRVRLGVIPRGYPETELSPDQQEAVKKVLLRKVLSQRREPFKPKFVFCKAKTGHILLSCQDKATADWVRTTVQQITPWRGAELEALDEANMPRQEVLLGFFYRSKNDDNETILGFLESQNDDMDTTMWKILQRTVRNDHVEWAFTVDMASMKLLEARSFVVNFKFGQTLIRKGRSDNVGAQEVAGLNPIDRMEVDSDVDDHEFGEPGPSMIATSQTIGSCAKGGDPSQGKGKSNDDFSEKQSELNSRVPNAQCYDSEDLRLKTDNDVTGKNSMQDSRVTNAQCSAGEVPRLIPNNNILIQANRQTDKVDHPMPHEDGSNMQ